MSGRMKQLTEYRRSSSFGGSVRRSGVRTSTSGAAVPTLPSGSRPSSRPLSSCGVAPGNVEWNEDGSSVVPQQITTAMQDYWPGQISPSLKSPPHRHPSNLSNINHNNTPNVSSSPLGHDYAAPRAGWEVNDYDLPKDSNNAHNLDKTATLGGADELLYPPRAFWTFTDKPGVDLRAAGIKAVSHLSRLYVILFGVGKKDTEGIYSMRAFSEEGLPHETIIAFEDEEDALRYSSLLEATMDHEPSVCSIVPQELLDFCQDSNYQCRLEAKGSFLIPPEMNVGITDWERSMRLRKGYFTVLDADPEANKHGVAGHHMGRWPVPQGLSTVFPETVQPTGAQQEVDGTTQFSDDQLVDIRAKLESLLPPSESDDSDDDVNTQIGPSQA